MAAIRLAHALATIGLATIGLAAAVTPTAAAGAAPAASAAASAAGNTGTGTRAEMLADARSASADVDDFSYEKWDARFDVSLDDEGRARMHVTETLTARFPDFDQNKGIVRGMPTSYENAWLELQILSVTDGSGAEVPYETDEDDGLLYVLTGDDDYVQGTQTYVIEYEMRDVVLSADTGVDEFYWDLLPLDSTQPVEEFSADVVFDAQMTDRMTGATRCYVGYAGSTDECPLAESADGSAFHVEANELSPGQGVTVAVGFEAGTAAQPSAREPDPVTDTVPAIAALGGLGLSVGGWFAVSSFKRSRRTADGIVVAQYDVPDSLPPLLAAAIVPGAKAAIPAEIVHLAVRGTVRIEEGTEAEEPRLRRLPGGRIPDQLDVEALDALFTDADADGVAELPTSSEEFAARMTALSKSGAEAAESRGLVTKARSRGAMILQWCAIAVVVTGFGLGLWGIIAGRVTALPAFVAIAFGLFLVLLSSLYSFSKHTVLTTEGARQYEYLMGVREFIRVAEADRLRMLQSYSGAERRHDGGANVIVVYERLLPYAMLFGMEDEWGQVLETAYTSAQRGATWIGDPTAPFVRGQLVAFAASSNAAATYSAPSASSSSSAGGSFGGGFSGGGGGGGFSGGR
ncbi:putative membrane protein YgcG [Microbacterium phyllosphaerae]|uniref:Membrane protein YgcG n=1 Tax=Microbacterium phyllosphaerae TaxID=124798 RepID=A0ABS4WN69_9MICO|nr:DUF2207 domain-containing protein [Microbacterium phyllosphaerae]MBP2377650.1 putative membrane protein YgcG [Microbacterium phyllosphaerae]